MAEARVERRLAAILATDVAGYSRLMGVDEEGTLAALKAVRRELIDPKIAEHNGRMVKTTGDGALVEFASAVDAVRCAMEIQRTMAERNAIIPEDRRIEFRIGINVGDIIFDGGDIFGDGVNVAARLEGLAEPGGICVSSRVQEDAQGRLDITFEDGGEQKLKNITRSVHVYHFRMNGAAATTQPALPDKPSIAVLPFQNMSGDVEQEYFADGMVEDITTAISKVRWLFVISRNSAFTYKGRQIDVKQAARELGVRYILEGSVRRAGNRLRITAQLIDAATSLHVWAERYDRDVSDVFAVQDEITEHVVAAIEPQLYAAEGLRANRKPPNSLDAWECVVRALSLMNARSKPEVTAARDLLKKAVSVDPNYALAQSLLSFVTTLHVHFGWEQRESTLPVALEAARKAILLDPDEPWAHLALGYVMVWSRRSDEAITEGQRAIQLNPNFSMGYYLLSLAAGFLGQGDDALTYAEQSARLSPRDLLARGNAGVMNNVRATACFISARYRDGIDFARKAIAESPSLIPAYRMLVVNCALAGEIDEAKKALHTLRDLSPNVSQRWIELDWPYVRSEEQRRLREAFTLAGLE